MTHHKTKSTKNFRLSRGDNAAFVRLVVVGAPPAFPRLGGDGETERRHFPLLPRDVPAFAWRDSAIPALSRRGGPSRLRAGARLGGALPAYPFGSTTAAGWQGDAPLPLSFGRRRQRGAAALHPASSRRDDGGDSVARRSFRGLPPGFAGDWEVRRRSPRFLLLATWRSTLAATLVRCRATRPRTGVGARSPGPSDGSSPLGSRACALPLTRRPSGLARAAEVPSDAAPSAGGAPHAYRRIFVARAALQRLPGCLAAGAREHRCRGLPAGAEDGASAGGGRPAAGTSPPEPTAARGRGNDRLAGAEERASARGEAGCGGVAVGTDHCASKPAPRTQARRRGLRDGRGADCGTAGGPSGRTRPWDGRGATVIVGGQRRA